MLFTISARFHKFGQRNGTTRIPRSTFESFNIFYTASLKTLVRALAHVNWQFLDQIGTSVTRIDRFHGIAARTRVQIMYYAKCQAAFTAFKPECIACFSAFSLSTLGVLQRANCVTVSDTRGTVAGVLPAGASEGPVSGKQHPCRHCTADRGIPDCTEPS